MSRSTHGDSFPPIVDLGELKMTAEEAELMGEDPEVVRFLRVTEQLLQQH